MRAITYARVSGDDRGKEGRNLKGQLEMCRGYCQEKSYRVIAELAEDDKGASGASWDLPKLNQALDMARAGEFDVLVTRELDRFARGLAKQLVAESEFKRFGVEIAYVLADYEDSPEGRLNKHIRATIAEFEREKIAQRTIRARKNKVRGGSVLTHGNPPFGYAIRKDEGKTSLVICEQEAEIVRQVFALYTGDDSPSISAVARLMTGIPTCADLRQSASNPKVREYGKWSAGSVSNILENEAYAGVWTYADDPALSVKIPAIISRETWQKTQERKKHNTKFSRRNGKHEYLLAKRVKCTCGSAMICRSRTWKEARYFYYSCNARLYATECDATKFWRADHVDARVWKWIENDLFGDPQRLADSVKNYIEYEQESRQKVVDRANVANDLLTENRRKLERLLEAYLDNPNLPKEWLIDKQKTLETTIWSLEHELSELNVTLQSWQTLKEYYEEIGGRPEYWQDFVVRMQTKGSSKKDVVEKLDVQAVLFIENGEQKIHARCTLGEKVLSIVSASSRTR